MRRQSTLSLLTFFAFTWMPFSSSFNPKAVVSDFTRRIPTPKQPRPSRLSERDDKLAPHQQQLLYSKNEGNDTPEESNELIIVRGFEEDEISDETWDNIEANEPPKWIVMKEILGINVFTYILAVLIAFFLTVNFVLGPGWLGQAIGIKGTGTFTDISPSLPDTLDLNDPNFLL